MRIDVFTIFPGLIDNYLAETVVARALREGLFSLGVHDIRSMALDVHRSVDDSPFGGGAGMLMKCQPIFDSVEAADPPRPIYLLSPSGRVFDQRFAEELAQLDGFSLIAGRYEGFDARIEEHLADGAISIGDFVLAGGELAALCVIESVVRLIPGALGNQESVSEESFATGLLEYPQYTRPQNFRNYEVPSVLIGGNHKLIADWRLAQSLARTLQIRPDLIEKRGGLTAREAEVLKIHGYAWMVEEETESFEDP